jgi:hypothetical protein
MEINQNTSTAASGQVKFTAEEIKELSIIRQGYEELTLALGQLELQKRELKKNETRVNDRLTAVEASEKAFLDKIVAKYGEGTFDIATGVFTPKKTV